MRTATAAHAGHRAGRRRALARRASPSCGPARTATGCCTARPTSPRSPTPARPACSTPPRRPAAASAHPRPAAARPADRRPGRQSDAAGRRRPSSPAAVVLSDRAPPAPARCSGPGTAPIVTAGSRGWAAAPAPTRGRRRTHPAAVAGRVLDRGDRAPPTGRRGQVRLVTTRTRPPATYAGVDPPWPAADPAERLLPAARPPGGRSALPHRRPRRRADGGQLASLAGFAAPSAPSATCWSTATQAEARRRRGGPGGERRLARRTGPSPAYLAPSRPASTTR